MNRVIRNVIVGLASVSCLALVGVGTAGAQSTTTTTTTSSTTTTTAPPFASGNKYMSFNVETVVGYGSPTGSVYPGSCTLENDFGLGATVVFRMWGTDFENGAGTPLVGGAGVSPNVQSVTISGLPGMTSAPAMLYSTRDGYWTYGWATTTSTPVGTVAYTVTVTLDPVNPVYTTAYRNVLKTVNGKREEVRVSYKKLVSAQIPAESYTFVPPSTQDVVLSASV